MNRLTIELLEGEAIVEAYRNYVGGSSCMTGGNCDFVRMYAMNPQVFRLLVMRQNGNSARALVTKLDSGKYLMDRIYCDGGLLSERWKAFDTPEFITKTRPERSIRLGFAKRNTLGRNCRTKEKTSVEGNSCSTVTVNGNVNSGV